MKIKWELNSRVKQMAADGIIDSNDVIKRTTTNNFPAGFATVRLQQVANKNPWVTLHIKGHSRTTKDWNGGNCTWATTMRASWGLQYRANANLSGELCETLTFQDVHDAVTKVKKAMEN
jgi:hypothetical protein